MLTGLPAEFASGTAAAFLLLATLYCSHAAALKLLPHTPRSLRWSAAALLASWAAIFSFHVLAGLNLFRLPAALVLVSFVVLATRTWTAIAFRDATDMLFSDLVQAARYVHRGAPGVTRLGRFALLGLASTVLARAMILPPLGWDSITYHAVKAALWVQSGGGLDLAVPGFWQDFKYFPPGGEILGAWAMLPFSSDLAYLLVDVLVWICLVPVFHALAVQFSVPTQHRRLLVLYLMTVPALFFWIGSGYVEVTLHLLLLGGLVFMFRAIERKDAAVSSGLWLLAWVTALSVKITALPLLLLSPILVLVVLLRNRTQKLRVLSGLTFGALAAAAALAPTLARNTRELGFPLSPFPARFAGLTFGETGPALALMGNTVNWSWSAELKALAEVLGIGPGANLGPLAIPILLLGLAAAVPKLRGGFLLTRIALVFSLLVAAPYFSPSYAATRVISATSNGRFLFPVLVVLATLAATQASRFPALFGRRLLRALVVAAAVGSMLTNLVVNASPREWPALIATMILVPLFVAGFERFRESRSQTSKVRIVFVASLLLLGVASVIPLRLYRENFRYDLLKESRVAHELLTYWVDTASEVDQPETARRIAITGGPREGPRGFMYFFLGSRLQNRLSYVAPTRDGTPPTPWQTGAEWPDQLDDAAWFERLREADIDYVVSLLPPGPEVEWLESNSKHFTFVTGVRRSHGLWRFEQPSPR